MKIPESLIKELDFWASRPTKHWRIKWCGKFLTVRSKKTAWKTEAAARSALRNHLNYGNTPYFLAKENGVAQNLCHCEDITTPYIKELIKQLEASGDIQFVEEK